MSNYSSSIVLALSFTLLTSAINAQSCTEMDLRKKAEIASSCNSIVMTMLHDKIGRDVLYVANKSNGLACYDISDNSAPILIGHLATDQYASLHVMNLDQDGNYLYLSIGNHFTDPQQGGMAVVDVSDPSDPKLTDHFILPNSENGAGIVKLEGEYAYLGAMKSGLVILDVRDKYNIRFVSQFIPDINFPVEQPNPDLYNARGMYVKNSMVYLCYDAGGFRIIDCNDKEHPVEISQYANPSSFMPFNLPRAYNNIAVDNSKAYITVDYCGLEVFDISDPYDIELIGWWNPYDCPGNNWFTSPSHTNEIFLNAKCDQLFVSTGKSDMIVLDISDPTQPDSCNYYGGIDNGIGTWGVSSYEDEIYLSYICAFIPFASSWTGVHILSYKPCTLSSNEKLSFSDYNIFPNPTSNRFTIECSDLKYEPVYIELYDSHGKRLIKESMNTNSRVLDLDPYPAGIYFVHLMGSVHKLMKI